MHLSALISFQEEIINKIILLLMATNIVYLQPSQRCPLLLKLLPNFPITCTTTVPGVRVWGLLLPKCRNIRSTFEMIVFNCKRILFFYYLIGAKQQSCRECIINSILQMRKQEPRKDSQRDTGYKLHRLVEVFLTSTLSACPLKKQKQTKKQKTLTVL